MCVTAGSKELCRLCVFFVDTLEVVLVEVWGCFILPLGNGGRVEEGLYAVSAERWPIVVGKEVFGKTRIID